MIWVSARNVATVLWRAGDTDHKWVGPEVFALLAWARGAGYAVETLVGEPDVADAVIVWARESGYQGDKPYTMHEWVWVPDERSPRAGARRLVTEWRLAGCPGVRR